ncbi:hypothetical protein [Methyloglobulus sp.]|uniref:hypothetical protein n=1 Tax=Methyloglobulus sp. TaxID=2518622 RepID=UPI0032B7A51B
MNRPLRFQDFKVGRSVKKHAVLTDSRQLFASKYLPYLPTEEELRLELQRERSLLINMQKLPGKGWNQH